MSCFLFLSEAIKIKSPTYTSAYPFDTIVAGLCVSGPQVGPLQCTASQAQKQT